MSNRNSEIKIKVSAEAEQVNRAFNDIKASADKLRRQVGPAFAAMRSDLGRVGGAVKGVVSPVGDLSQAASLISFAGAVAGAMALKGYIDQIKDITLQTSNEISRMFHVAASFNLDQDLAGEAVKRVRALEAVYESFAFTAADAEKINTTLTSLAADANAGSDGAIAKWRALGIYKEDLFKANGELKAADDLLASISSRTRGMERGKALAGLSDLVGRGSASKLLRMFSVLEQGTGSFADQLEYFADIIESRDEDIKKSEELQGALIDEQLRWENLQKSIFRGFVPAMIEASAARSRFFDGLGDEAEMAGDLAGRLYSSVSEGYYDQASRLVAILTSATEGGVAPMEAAFDRIDVLIKAIFAGVVDIVELIATGESDAPWLEGVAESVQKVRTDIGELAGQIGTAANAVSTLFEKLGSFYELFGIDQPWMQVGITAGLVVFSRTIVAVLTLVGRLVAAISTATGATAALGAAAGGAGAAAGGAAAAVAGAAKKAVKTGAGVAGGVMLINEAQFIQQVQAILDRGVALAETEGEAFAAGFMKTALDELRSQKGGDGLVMGWLDRLIDQNFGTNLIPDFGDLEAEIDIVVNEVNAGEAVRGARAAFRELSDALGWDVDDEGRIEIGGGISITGADLKAGTLDGILEQLQGLQATIEVAPIDIEGALGDYRMKMPELQVRPGEDWKKGPNTTSLQPVTIIIDGKQSQLEMSPASVEPLRQALQMSARTRS